MRYCYDFEFLEDGHTIEPISVGIVCEDGRELYAVNRNAPWRRIRKHNWLMNNVVPYLPQAHGDARNHIPRRWMFNYASPLVQPLATIASRVSDFLAYTPGGRDPVVQLWAWCGAYDHVALAQLFGPMVKKPPHIPNHTNDLQTLLDMLNIKDEELPPVEAGHNALADARYVQRVLQMIGERFPDPQA